MYYSVSTAMYVFTVLYVLMCTSMYVCTILYVPCTHVLICISAYLWFKDYNNHFCQELVVMNNDNEPPTLMPQTSDERGNNESYLSGLICIKYYRETTH